MAGLAARDAQDPWRHPDAVGRTAAIARIPLTGSWQRPLLLSDVLDRPSRAMYIHHMVRTQLYLDEAIHRRLSVLARKQGRTLSALVRDALARTYGAPGADQRRASLHAVEGLWRDRKDIADTDEYVRHLRRNTRRLRNPRGIAGRASGLGRCRRDPAGRGTIAESLAATESQGIPIYCCAITWAEIGAGLRPGEEAGDRGLLPGTRRGRDRRRHRPSRRRVTVRAMQDRTTSRSRMRSSPPRRARPASHSGRSIKSTTPWRTSGSTIRPARDSCCEETGTPSRITAPRPISSRTARPRGHLVTSRDVSRWQVAA